MIKVIDIELNPKCWITKSEKLSENSEEPDKKIIWYECPALNKFISDGWKINDCKMSEHDAIFILEKRNIKK